MLSLNNLLFFNVKDYGIHRGPPIESKYYLCALFLRGKSVVLLRHHRETEDYHVGEEGWEESGQ
jgi:hypothetical protein